MRGELLGSPIDPRLVCLFVCLFVSHVSEGRASGISHRSASGLFVCFSCYLV